MLNESYTSFHVQSQSATLLARDTTILFTSSTVPAASFVIRTLCSNAHPRSRKNLEVRHRPLELFTPERRPRFSTDFSPNRSTESSFPRPPQFPCIMNVTYLFPKATACLKDIPNDPLLILPGLLKFSVRRSAGHMCQVLQLSPLRSCWVSIDSRFLNM